MGRRRTTSATVFSGSQAEHQPRLVADPVGVQLGLGTTGAVTRMVDRLERAGYLRRQPDPMTAAG